VLGEVGSEWEIKFEVNMVVEKKRKEKRKKQERAARENKRYRKRMT
jgi:hypothetical protein